MFKVNDRVQVNDEARGELTLDAICDIHYRPRYLRPGEQGVVLAVGREQENPYEQLIYCRMDDGRTDNLLACWIDVIEAV